MYSCWAPVGRTDQNGSTPKTVLTILATMASTVIPMVGMTILAAPRHGKVLIFDLGSARYNLSSSFTSSQRFALSMTDSPSSSSILSNKRFSASPESLTTSPGLTLSLPSLRDPSVHSRDLQRSLQVPFQEPPLQASYPRYPPRATRIEPKSDSLDRAF